MEEFFHNVLMSVLVAALWRFRGLFVGAAVLALTAANMMVEDLDVWYKTRWRHGAADVFPSWAAWTLRVVVVAVCVTTNRGWPKDRIQHADPSSAKQDSRPMERVLD